MLRDFVFQTVVPILITVLGGVLIWALARLSVWFAAQAQSSKAYAVGSAAYETVRSIVEHVERHLRPQVTAALADGKVTKEEADRLKAEALRMAKEALGSHGLSKLGAVFGGGTDVLLSGWIERAVKEKHAPVLGIPAPTAPLPPQ